MVLIAVYLVFMIIGDLLDYAIGSFIEKEWPSIGLTAFLALYFATLWLAWVLAVRVTEPKKAAA